MPVTTRRSVATDSAHSHVVYVRNRKKGLEASGISGQFPSTPSQSLSLGNNIGEQGLHPVPMSAASKSVSFFEEGNHKRDFSTSSSWWHSLSNLFRNCCRSFSHFPLSSNRDNSQLISSSRNRAYMQSDKDLDSQRMQALWSDIEASSRPVFLSRDCMKVVTEEIISEGSRFSPFASRSGSMLAPKNPLSICWLLLLLLIPLCLLGALFSKPSLTELNSLSSNALTSLKHWAAQLKSYFHDEGHPEPELNKWPLESDDNFDSLFKNFHDKLADLERRYEILSAQTDSNASSLKNELSSLEQVHGAHESFHFRLRSDLHSLQKLFTVVLKELSLFRRSLNSVRNMVHQHDSLLTKEAAHRASLPPKCECPTSCPSSDFDWNEVDAHIAASLKRYDSDKTGLPDYALESAGGTILSVRCTESYDPKSRVLTLFGIPVFYKTYSPRKIIQPGTMPGECWAFKGSVGSVVIQLGGTIRITGISYEHVAKSIAPDGHIESAPKNFEVYGLMSKNDANATLLGNYTYRDDGDALQYFPVQATNASTFPIVELKVLRNHEMETKKSNQVDKREKSSENAESFVAKYLLSCVAATVAESATYPLDLLKTRLQLQGEHDLKCRPKMGAFSLLSHIVSSQGALSLWQGVTPAVLRHYIYTGFRVVIYEECREHVFRRNPDGTFALWKAMLTGVLSGALAQFVASPTDLIKVLLQAEGRRKLEGLPPRVNSVRHAFKVVWSEGGILALWRGWMPGCQRAALVNMSDMATYDTVKHFVLKHSDMPDNYITHAISSCARLRANRCALLLNVGRSSSCSLDSDESVILIYLRQKKFACSGLAAALTSTPMDVVKTRMMNQSMPSRVTPSGPNPYEFFGCELPIFALRNSSDVLLKWADEWMDLLKKKSCILFPRRLFALTDLSDKADPIGSPLMIVRPQAAVKSILLFCKGVLARKFPRLPFKRFRELIFEAQSARRIGSVATMLEGPPPAEYRSFRSLSRANRASICRKSRSSIVAPPSPTSKRRQSSGSPSVDGGKRSSPLVVPEVVSPQAQSTPPVGSETAATRHNGSDSLARDLLSANGDEENDGGVPYPTYSAKALLCLDQRTPPRSWCLRIVSNPYPFSSKRLRFFVEPFCHSNSLLYICFLNSLFTWFEKVSMMVILINCVTLGMYRPCDEDSVATSCTTVRCKILATIDHMVFAFFAIEMVMKIIALGFYGGDQAYLSETWNRLDFFIVVAGCAEYIFKDQMGDINLTAIRTVRVLRPLRAINRIPSMRILVNLLLDTLPMLGNVLLLCFFVFFIFGIVGVQLWAGLLRNRCLLNLPPTNDTNRELIGLMQYYMPDETSMEYICSLEKDHGRHSCTNLQPSTYNGHVCNLTIDHWRSGSYSPQNNSCINWNQYYTKCGPTSHNPFQGSVSFDNIGYAWVSIYLVISLEGWSDIMYYVQDAHSFWDWVYFVLLIVIGAFFMINLCLVVIATQFAETKRRETERMMAERALYYSSSTLATIDQPSESDGVYRAIVKYIAHLGRRAKRKALRYYRSYWQKSSDHSPASLRELPIAYASSAEPTTVALPPKRSSIRRKRIARQPAGRPSLANELALPSSRDSLSPSRCYSIPGAAASSHDSSSLSFFSAVDDSIVGPSETGSCPPAFVHRKRRNSRRSSSQGKRFSDNSVMSTETMASHQHARDTFPAVRKPRKQYKLKYTESAPGGRPRSDAQGRLLVNEPFLESGRSLGSEEDDDDRTIFSEDEADGEQEDGEEEEDDNDVNDGASAVAMKTFDTEKGRERVKFADKRRSLFDGSARSRKSRLWHVVQRMQNRVKRFVDGDHFTRGILVAILVNTLSMGIEYHNQPEELTLVLEYSNILFTALFAVEMLLKLIAEGPFGYISDGFNLFDGGIVVLRQVSPKLANTALRSPNSSGNGGLSVLRTFRLLRILKLVRFMPALRYQLIVMLRTMDNVTVFFGLLCLFIFIFSILGMNLFGCKFCRQEEASDGTQVRLCDRKNFDSLFWATLTVFQRERRAVVGRLVAYLLQVSQKSFLFFPFSLLGMELFAGRFCHTVDGLPCPCKMKEVTCVCSRRNFDTFIQAAFTVFQILTQEDWNVVLFNGMAQTSPWAALYFIALMTFGNYVLFNLLVAILVEGFQESKEEEKRLLQEQQQDEISGDISEAKKLPATEAGTDRPLLTCTCAAAAAAAAAAAILSGKHRERLLSLPALPMQFSCSDVGLAPPPIIQTLPTPADSPLLGRSVHMADKSSESLSSNQENGHLKMDPNLSSYSSISIKSNSPSACTPQDSGSKRPCRYSMAYLGIPGYPSTNRKLQRHWSSVSSPTKPETIPEIGYSLSCEDNFKSLAACNPEERSSLTVPGALAAQCNGGLSASGLPSLNGKRNSWLLKRDVPLSPMHSAKVGIPGSLHPYCRVHGCRLSLVPDSYSVEAISRSGLLMSDQFGTVGYLSHRLKKSPKSLLRSWFHGWFEKSWFNTRMDYSLFLFSLKSSIRVKCIYLCEQKWFDFFILTFIGINCVTLAMERPDIPPMSVERMFLDVSNYVFTAVFAVEMLIKVIAKGLVLGDKAYFKNGWDFMDGTLVIISFCNLLFDLLHRTDAPRIFSVVRVLRLLRALRPLRVINRAPGVKLVVQTLISSLKPIGNIVLICCTFFIIFGILGVQLFKGKMWHCVGPSVAHVVNKTDCLADPHNRWVNHRYNFDNLGQALMSLFVVASKDGWVSIMYQGIDAVAVDMQPVVNYFEWRMLYFISFLLLVGFFVLNMFVGVVVENFHRCKEALEKEMKEKEREKKMRKRLQKQMSRQQLLMKKAHKLPYWYHYGPTRLYIHSIVTSKYFDLAISAVIGVNVITMAMEFHMMPAELSYTLKVFNYFFTVIFTLEAMVKIYALGIRHYLIDRWNQLDVLIVILSISGIILEEMESKVLPINPTIMRVMRMLRIARILKLLKMAKGIRSLLDTVMQALPQVGNLGLLFFLLFFIFAALGVELFGRLVNLLVYILFQFVLVNVVVAVLMKHLEESSKKMADGSSETGGSAATDSDAFMRSDTDDEKGPKAKQVCSPIELRDSEKASSSKEGFSASSEVTPIISEKEICAVLSPNEQSKEAVQSSS
ncbi:hypothetical protein M514_09876 [Trichuris suis]|uniref:Voltage-dependent T-type calcium channel subunit alpha n=1 Tax=Trichuris suis TaxID=68888 RepID=A0A085N7Z2_9BILA|nr:hypothetical protein M514_09876 [Trichuris suis]